MGATEDRLDALDKRLDVLERKQAALDAGVTFIRWIGPIAVGLVAVLLGNH